ncbi:daptide biosynthesis intramembrane metalloprotease [Arthrobacter sp. MA-N2]|uniref:daptide biosynthesis intramembrane metalloprotease n=1 Tax=Arthrobacter sp. MA-N2 TaxID=1101188 RepID=UPI0004B522CB|nr:daptide biosynthesis intramembrane metalloprotease [Arthrobacter sp. MA-N2]
MADTQPTAASGTLAPRLRKGLEIEASGQEWTVADPSGRIFRISADIAALLNFLDGIRTRQELPAQLTQQTGRRWTSEAVDQALESFAAKGLIEDGTQGRKKPPRIRFVPPLTLQIGFFSPAPFLHRIRRTLEWLVSTPLLVVYGLIILLGATILAVSAGDVWAALTTPLPLSTYLAVASAMMLSTMLHEMGHGATLAAFGGKPRQIGFMLFYLTPAFFCDVSDGWRLDSKWKRVSIALAGIVTQGVLAGTASLFSLAASVPEVKAGLLVYAVLGYTSEVINLIPFVKLDGYIALMSYLDISHLRDKALRDARRLISRVLFGHSSKDELPPLRRFKIYGLLCMLFPAYLIVTVLSLWLDVIARFGIWGAGTALLVVALVAARVAAGYLSIVREGWDRPGSRKRILAVSVLLLTGVAVSGAYIQIPAAIEAGFVNDAGGTGVVFEANSSVPHLDAGQVVDVYGSGLINTRKIGSLKVRETKVSTRTVPLNAIAPFTLPGAQLLAEVIPLESEASNSLPSSGTALIRLQNRNTYEWLNEKYLQPVIAGLSTGRPPTE